MPWVEPRLLSENDHQANDCIADELAVVLVRVGCFLMADRC